VGVRGPRVRVLVVQKRWTKWAGGRKRPREESTGRGGNQKAGGIGTSVVGRLSRGNPLTRGKDGMLKYRREEGVAGKAERLL